MPALPLDEAGKYVAAAYLIFVALLLIYVAIMASRLSRFEREIGELAELAKARVQSATPVSERAAEEVHAGAVEESA
jgi:hypothetical protein